MTNLDSEYWSQRYKNNEIGWDTGSITTPLKEYFDQLTRKELLILIPGAGNAYEAEYLVNLGFKNVFVCDLADEPLQALKQRCPLINNEQLLKEDFFKLKSNKLIKDQGGFDLIIEQTFFCALNPSLRKDYFKQMFHLLRPGGKLVGLLFDDPLNQDKPPFGGNKEEYHQYFKDHFKIKKFEACYNSIKPRAGRELFVILEK